MTIDTHEAFALLTEMEMQRMDDSDDQGHLSARVTSLARNGFRSTYRSTVV